MTNYRELYNGVLWLGAGSVVALPAVVITQSASLSDGLSLSVILVSIFFLAVSCIAWLGVVWRAKSELHAGERYVYGTSLRQGTLVGATIVALLLLQLIRIITLIDALILVALAVVLELYFASRRPTTV